MGDDVNIYMDEFYKKSNNNNLKLIDKIFDDEDNIFVIQDYMTIKLSNSLKKEIDKYKKNNKCEILFLTDIRTSLLKVKNNQDSPSDLDILWNYALQIIFIKILMPSWSMLKFRPPFFNDTKYEKTKKFIEKYNDTLKSKTSNYDSISNIYDVAINDIIYVKKNYNLDMINNYKKGIFKYLKHEIIYTQTWAPSSSTETRLIIKGEDLFKNNNYVKYDNIEWEEKFNYFNLMRNYYCNDIFDNFIKSKYNEDNFYNYSYDSCREICILVDYFIKDNKKKQVRI